jgi:hypothetical protein
VGIYGEARGALPSTGIECISRDSCIICSDLDSETGWRGKAVTLNFIDKELVIDIFGGMSAVV